MNGVQFKLKLFTAFDSTGIMVEAEIQSSRLNKKLHPELAAPVMIQTDFESIGNTPHVVLDYFQYNSLAAYVEAQESLDDALRKILIADLQTDPSFLPSDSDILNDVQIDHVFVRSRDEERAAYFANEFQNLSGLELDPFDHGPEMPQTQSYFILILKCRWEEEHRVRVCFRNKLFSGIEHS